MKPDDPNFPEEIPPIADPRKNRDSSPVADGNAIGEEASDGADDGDKQDKNQWSDGAETGGVVNPNSSGAGSSADGVAFEDSDENFDSDDIDYDQTLEAPAGARIPPQAAPSMDATLKPPVEQPRASDRSPREAEKPVEANEPFDDWGQSEVPYQPKELGIIDQLLLVLADGVAAWRKVLRWVRSQLPPTWQRRLSDEVMTAISLGLLVLLLAVWNPLGGGQGTAPEAITPSPETAVEPPQAGLEPSAPQDETPDLAPAPGITSIPEKTPEQSLISDIQDKVSNISRAYAAGLIQSVEVNLPENRLIVNLGENWYGLMNEQQDDVSQSIFDEVQQLDFKTLQLRDPDGVVVARNPVVGTNMIILHRSRSSEADLLIS
jgi:hypothetical protein